MVEYTVERILRSNVRNVMMEFTATLNLNHPEIYSKYADKILYDYSLAKFREDGYSKEIETNEVDYEPIQRALVAVIVSQYKKKLFANNGVIAKPVILFKSKTTSESKEMEWSFKEEVQSLSVSRLENLIKLNNTILNKALSYFEGLDVSLQGLVDEIREDFSQDKIISINSKNDSDEKQIIINSLEDYKNQYRGVFAVDKLNEGWDVLNLYDIVRLYDTRDFNKNRPGRTTVSEAQLIGRGARYYPFEIRNDQEGVQEKDKRKYDNDITNILRDCETLHYHCSNNPSYITELKSALRQTGLLSEERKEIDLFLKDEFKETSLYKHGFIFLNKKVENTPEALSFEYQEPMIVKKHYYNLRTTTSKSALIFNDNSSRTIKKKVHPVLRNIHF